MADHKRDSLNKLYQDDPRVVPWSGTAHGVLQTVNTYDHHEGVVGGGRPERNNLKTVSGDFGRLDRKPWDSFRVVIASAA